MRRRGVHRSSVDGVFGRVVVLVVGAVVIVIVVGAVVIVIVVGAVVIVIVVGAVVIVDCVFVGVIAVAVVGSVQRALGSRCTLGSTINYCCC